MSDRVFLTYDQAVGMLPPGKYVHTFVGGGMMIGADWSKKSILELLENGRPELSGSMATGMGHGIVAWRTVNGDNLSDPLFIETVTTFKEKKDGNG